MAASAVSIINGNVLVADAGLQQLFPAEAGHHKGLLIDGGGGNEQFVPFSLPARLQPYYTVN